MNNIIIYKNEMGDTVEFSRWSGFFLTDFPLLSGLPISVSTSQSIDQLGGTIESQVVNPKTVTVKGFIQGDGTAGKQKLLQVIRPLEKGRFTVNGQYSIDVVVSDTPTVERMRMFPQFDFGVTAPYPFWQRTEAGMTPVAFPPSTTAGKSPRFTTCASLQTARRKTRSLWTWPQGISSSSTRLFPWGRE